MSTNQITAFYINKLEAEHHSSVKPLHYDISLFDLSLSELDWTYSGRVEIDMDVRKACQQIVVNAHRLDILSTTLSSGCDASIAHTSLDNSTQRLVIHLNKAIEPSSTPVQLLLTYKAQIDGDLTGFYRSREAGNSGIEKYVFCTQFQPSDARRAFPCFDEPDFKATFDLSIEAPKDLSVISNMPEKSSKPSERIPAHRTVSFERTPKMSTYLLAWAIGKLECIETVIARQNSKAPLSIRIFASSGSVHHGRFALEFASRVIEYFTRLFGIPYPLPKLDLLAVNEMSDDAMENWGLVIFRSTALLLDEETTDLGLRTRIAYIIAHELAHQWFGNAVTMTWWDELWLNEGFATWAGWDACDSLYPEWNVWGQFVALDLQEAFRLDSVPSSHPVEVPVLDGLEVDSIFDSISYLKGASLVRMLVAYFGRDVFLEGLSAYLSAHMYENATADNLWSALKTASGKDVAPLVQQWIKTMGFPIVSIEETKPGRVCLRQSPVLPTNGGDTWFIPLCIQTSTVIMKHSLEAHTGQLDLDGDLVKLNVDQLGFYRTKYPTDFDTGATLDRLVSTDQAALLGDTMAMASLGYRTPTSAVLELIEKLHGEADFVIWTSILSCLHEICLIFSSDKETAAALDAFTRRIAEPTATRLGWSPSAGESYSTQRLRPLLLSAAGLANDEETVWEACHLFDSIQSGEQDSVHPHLRETVFQIAVHAKGLDAITFLQSEYHKTTSPHEREYIARVMGELSSSTSARSCLHDTFCSTMAAQDLRTLAIAMANNPAVPGIMWTFIRSEWELVCSRLAGSMAIFEPFSRRCLDTLNSQEQAEEVERFFEDKDTMGYQRGLTVALDMIRANAKYRERDAEDVKEWLRSRGFLT